MTDFSQIDPHVHWYDRQGQEISMERACELLEDFDYKVLKKDLLMFGEVPLEVSTVWLGLNHSWSGGLLIFETMIFAPGTRWDLQCWRYTTEAEALEGHQEVIAMLRSEEDRLRRHLGGESSGDQV